MTVYFTYDIEVDLHLHTIYCS